MPHAVSIAIIGTGYVGLVTGACLADIGHRVVCIDHDQRKIDALAAGRVPMYEPGIETLVQNNLAAGRLSFSSDTQAAVQGADAVFIAVGTPSRRGDGDADLSFVYAVAREIAPALNGFTVVATKSTVPVGTGDEVERLIRGANPEADFVVVSNPEFLREGAAVGDFQQPDRIIVGIDDARARPVMEAIYPADVFGGAPLLFVGRRTAEVTKYASNAFLAMKISFINEIADLCEATGADVEEVARGMGYDPRIGSQYLRAGAGYGGSCFPKDTEALVKTGSKLGVPMQLVATAIGVNSARMAGLAGRVAAACGGSVAGKTIGVLGLTFAPNTDDLRNAPALELIAGLQAAGANIVAYDPVGMAASGTLTEDVLFAANAEGVARGASAVVLVTEWAAFRAMDLVAMRESMVEPVFVDLRNVFDPGQMAAKGFEYFSVGRTSVRPER